MLEVQCWLCDRKLYLGQVEVIGCGEHSSLWKCPCSDEGYIVVNVVANE